MTNTDGHDRDHHVDAYLGDLERILQDLRPQLRDRIPQIADALEGARREGGTVYVMGNGGSGAAASHFANDLNKYTITDGEPRFRCVALTDNMPVILAIANDQDYDDIFVEQLRNHADPEDVLIGISGSGDSENCIRAIQYAKELGMSVVTWTGFGGGRMAELADLPVVIPSDSMVRCEDAHVIIHHCLVSLLKQRLERPEESEIDATSTPA